MKDVQEFQKLFKLTFPVEGHSDYYINTLMKSPFYAGLGKKVKEFEEFEEFVESQGIFQHAKSYKLDYAMEKLIDYIKGTEAYSYLLSHDFGKEKLRTKDELRNNDGNYLVSIDFKSANYSALKSYDYTNELFDSWEALCKALDIHPCLAGSKSFRQYVFGNTNPGRLQTTQHKKIVKIVDKLIEDHGFEEGDFVFISHDEFIVRLLPSHDLAVNRVNLLNSAIGNIIRNEDINMPTHYKIFQNEGIGGAGMCVQTQYEIKGNSLVEKYKTLFKVPGNKFFKYFKKHILNEPLDKRDLMFMSDGEIAVWAEDDDSVAETITPEGELSIQEIEKSYPYFIKKLKEEIPSLSESQIRRVINVSIDMCPHCFNDDRGCHCWNDD
jgi:hypothetical protein